MWRPHHPNFGQPPWDALPPNAKGGGAHMVLFGNLWKLPKDLPGPIETILGHSGTFRDGFGTFRNLLEHFHDLPGPFRNYLDRFRDDPGYGLACPMPCVCSSVVFGTSTD